MRLNVRAVVLTLKGYFDVIHRDFLHWAVGCNIEFVGNPGKYLPICLEAIAECKMDHDVAIRCIARGILLYIYIYSHIMLMMHPHW